METTLIENNNNGPTSLDYVQSDNAAEIDKGIRETIKGIRLSILAMGLGLVNMKAKKLYKDLGYTSLTHYINCLSDETKMDSGNIFSWLRIGEAYIKYQSELEQIGFSDSDGPTKLYYLEKALEKNKKQEVFDNIKNMSLREFKTLAQGQTITALPAGKRNRWKINIRGNSIYVNDKLAIILSKNIDPIISSYFMKVIHVMCDAVEHGGVILPVLLRNFREVRLFEPVVERLKTQIGMR